jgi:hypothetical protein
MALDLELQEALEQISQIRHQMARTELFRGYRALPVAFSGALAAVAAVAQAAWIPSPTTEIGPYLFLWICAALLSAAIAAGGMIARRRRFESAWSRESTTLAIELFIPSILAGGLLTAVVVVTAPDLAWLLPGLWQVLFSLGLFASARLLPWPLRFVAAWYLTTGITCLVVARAELALSPWAMGLPFGIGQALAAALLYWTLERPADGSNP